MSVDVKVEAIARAWMLHVGYTDEQITRAEIQSHSDAGCGYDGYGQWDCSHEDGTPLHPDRDALDEACDMARVAVETVESTGAQRKPLAERMRDAASTLEEVSAIYTYINPSLAEWSAQSLRHEAEHVEAEHDA